MKHAHRMTNLLVAVAALVLTATALAQPGRPGAPGACCLNGPQSLWNTAAPTQPLSTAERNALEVALQDEYKSRATYSRVLADFGTVRPFSNIVRAEGRHVAMLTQLYTRYGVPVPADTWATRVPAFDTLLAAAEASVQGEMDNGSLYDKLLADVTNPEVRAVFAALQYATMEHHLPAFQRFVDRASAGLNGQGRGQGYGRGNGLGNGRGYGRGNGLGNGQGYGRRNGLGNGQGYGRRNGLGNGQGYGRGNGLGNGQGYGRGKGLGNGQGYGRGNGLGNGQGYGRGNGLGNGRGYGRGAQQPAGRGPGTCWYNQGVTR